MQMRAAGVLAKLRSKVVLHEVRVRAILPGRRDDRARAITGTIIATLRIDERRVRAILPGRRDD